MSDDGALGSGGTRQQWADLPDAVRRAVADAAGGRVVTATSCAGGFSPGVAAVLALHDGSRRFVKAASSSPNLDTPQMHRSEIVVNHALPPAVPSPRLLWHHDDGDLVVLLLEHVDAAPPALPGTADDLERALRAVAAGARREGLAGGPPGPALIPVEARFW